MERSVSPRNVHSDFPLIFSEKTPKSSSNLHLPNIAVREVFYVLFAVARLALAKNALLSRKNAVILPHISIFVCCHSMNPSEYCRLAQHHRPTWLRLAHRFFHEMEAAEDIVQDALVKLWLVRERLQSSDDFAALGTRIVKNLCVNEWKRRQVRAEIDVPPPEITASSDTTAPLENAENRQLLRWALMQLPKAEARIFRLWSEEQLDIQQIAAILHLQPTSVSNALSKAKRKLFLLIQSRL